MKQLTNTTNFSKKQILSFFKKFYNAEPEIVPTDMTLPSSSRICLGKSAILKCLPELEFNPFCDRLLYIFSYNKITNPGTLNFYNYIDLLHFLSTRTATSLKLFHSFSIFDTDNDGEISGPDLFECVERLCNYMMTQQESMKIVEYVCQEADRDNEGTISFLEYESILTTCSDFVQSFSIRFA